MFHLDGLSYNKVADFLDIPLNTVKTLPDGFARKVLDNIPEIRYDKWECTFAGSVKACMDYFNHPVTYDYIMGISGAAFKLMWSPGKG
jgi:hypothetical protein